jgi:Bifunctional DNA primase/polymerase, N-terminal
MAETMMTAALSYAVRGWHVFPLHHMVNQKCSCGEDCGTPAKHPRYHRADLPSGHNSATTDQDLIRRWWARWPQANIGIAAGFVSGIVVIDIDPRNGGDLSLEDLEAEHGKFPATVESQTGGGGRHLIYQHPGGHLRCGTDFLGPGIDIKADGGYIVAPPSIHASGKCYEWEVSSHPDQMPLASLPEWIPLEDATEEDPETGKRRSMDDYTGDRPGDDYNRRVTRQEVRELLYEQGARLVHTIADVDYFCRPGKQGRAYSGTLGHLGGNRLRTFSPNWPLLPPKRGGYQPFAIYAILKHSSDFKAARHALAEQGYGRNHQPTASVNGGPAPDGEAEQNSPPQEDESLHD